MQTREIQLPGVRTEICLAVLCELYRVGGESTAYKILLPYEFTKKLADANIISSRRGRGGGIAIIPGFEAVTLADLVVAVEPHMLAREGTGCLLETALYRVMRKTKLVDLFPESALPKN